MVTSHAYPVRRSASILAIQGHPIYLMLDHYPIACFTLNLLTDVLYWRTSNLMWHDFSAWLLLAGLIFGAVELLALLIDVIGSRSLRATGLAWVYVLGLFVVLLLATLNSFIHAADGWSGVVPWGLTVSAVTCVAIVVTAWIGREMAMRSLYGERSAQ